MDSDWTVTRQKVTRQKVTRQKVTRQKVSGHIEGLANSVSNNGEVKIKS